MNNTCRFYGKSPVRGANKEIKYTTSLVQHTLDVLACAKVLQTKQIYKSEWINELPIACILHDVGKIDPDTQISMDNKKEKYFDGLKVSHNLLAMFFCNRDWFIEKFGDSAPAIDRILSSVTYHHWRNYYIELLSETGGDFNCKAGTILVNKEFWQERLLAFKQDLMELMEDSKYSDIQEKDLGFLDINDEYLYCGAPIKKLYIHCRLK